MQKKEEKIKEPSSTGKESDEISSCIFTKNNPFDKKKRKIEIS